MATIIKLEEIKAISRKIDVVAAMEEGFIKYSNGETVVPPVAELLFDSPPGDVHIKYGYVNNNEFFCIKIASGFYNNPELGIASSQGMMLLFRQKTGQPAAVLLDDGYLTDIRTAAAGALAAKYFAPKKISAIGIIGTGGQAKLQLEYLQKNTPCKTVWVWGRSIEKAQLYKEILGSDFDVHIAKTPSEVAQNCNLLVTTTPSEKALLFAKDIQPGTHITAVGSDTSEKRELQGEILQKSDIIISDSISQSKSRGEIFRAVQDGLISPNDVVELGNSLQDVSLQRRNDDQITIADLTGVAVQDIAISVATYLKYIEEQ